MTEQAQLYERYEDALFALMMNEFSSHKGKAWQDENERLKSDPDAAVPEQFNKRIKKRIRMYLGAQKAQKICRTAMKVTNRVAVIALIVALGFTATFSASAKLQAKTYNFIVETFENWTEFSFMPTNNALPQTITANWLPLGYEVVSSGRGATGYDAIYQTPDEKEISIYVTTATTSITIDTEDAVIEDVDVNGFEGVTIVKSGFDGNGTPYTRSRLVWIDAKHEWYIDITSYHENKEVLLQFANGLVIE